MNYEKKNNNFVFKIIIIILIYFEKIKNFTIIKM